MARRGRFSPKEVLLGAQRLTGQPYVNSIKKGRKGALRRATEGNPSRDDAPTPTGGGYIIGGPLNIANMRHMTVEEGTNYARSEPHLQPNPRFGEEGQGLYKSGPANIRSRADLDAVRSSYDDRVERGAIGMDWYDRIRASLEEIAPYDPQAQRLLADMHGVWSAGATPETELQFVLKEAMGYLTGRRDIGKFSAAHNGLMEALDEGGWDLGPGVAGTYDDIPGIGHNSGGTAYDPASMHLGPKTYEYARKLRPEQDAPSATGVNDRHDARSKAFSEGQINALIPGNHQYMDGENALVVDRANRNKYGGRDDWTGERVQAANWVLKKAEDLFATGRFETMQEALAEANKTAGDYYDKHTAYATYEEIPGVTTKHLPKAATAPLKEREAYTEFGSGWNTAEGGRDAIYAGAQARNRKGQQTPLGLYVRKSLAMQGRFEDVNGNVQYNPGGVGRVLVPFDKVGKSAANKRMGSSAQELLNAGEHIRAYIDGQDAGAAHAVWRTGQVGLDTSIRINTKRPSTPEEMRKVEAIAAKYGFPDVSDTGDGLTVTQFFDGGPSKLDKKKREAFVNELETAILDGDVEWVKMVPEVDGVYADFTKNWKRKKGSATRQLLNAINVTPETRRFFDDNPLIPEKALDNLWRDEAWQKKWGATRADLQNARKIIGEGRGWVGRLESALKRGEVLPAIFGAIIINSALGDEAEAANQPPKNTERELEMYDRKTTEDGYYRMPEGM